MKPQKKLVIVCLVIIILLNIHIINDVSHGDSRKLILQELGQFNDGGGAHDVHIIDNIAFIADGDDGLEIIKIWEGQGNETIESETARTTGFDVSVLVLTIISLSLIRKGVKRNFDDIQ